MKLLKQLLESDPRVGGGPSNEEMLGTFMDQVKGMNVQHLQSLVSELGKIGNLIVREYVKITDQSALVRVVGVLSKELQGNRDFRELVGQVVGTDEVLPPG